MGRLRWLLCVGAVLRNIVAAASPAPATCALYTCSAGSAPKPNPKAIVCKTVLACSSRLSWQNLCCFATTTTPCTTPTPCPTSSPAPTTTPCRTTPAASGTTQIRLAKLYSQQGTVVHDALKAAGHESPAG